jgi:putative FmdB family regulatory protein
MPASLFQSMPLYEFNCPECGPFSELRTIAQRNLPIQCPECSRKAARQVTSPNLALMAPNLRQAHARNEKSQHEPTVRTSHSCGSRCGCGTNPGVKLGKSNRSLEVPKLGKFQTTRKKSMRPWMLGH